MIKFNVLERFIILLLFSSLPVYGSIWRCFTSGKGPRSYLGSSSPASRAASDRNGLDTRDQLAAIQADKQKLEESLSVLTTHDTTGNWGLPLEQLESIITPIDKRISEFSNPSESSMAMEGANEFAADWMSQMKLLPFNHGLVFAEYPNYPNLRSILWWKCTLQAIDTLFKYHLVSQDAVAKFFEGPIIREQILHYALARFQESGVAIGISPYLTEHWYWSHMHHCFQVLGEDEKKLLNANYLFRFQREDMAEFAYSKRLATKAFFSSFKGRPYLEYLEGRQPSVTSDMIKKDVLLMIEIIAGIGQIQRSVMDKDIVLYLQYCLDFIERYIYPGIIEETINKQANPGQLNAAVSFMRQIANEVDMKAKARSYEIHNS